MPNPFTSDKASGLLVTEQAPYRAFGRSCVSTLCALGPPSMASANRLPVAKAAIRLKTLCRIAERVCRGSSLLDTRAETIDPILLKPRNVANRPERHLSSCKDSCLAYFIAVPLTGS